MFLNIKKIFILLLISGIIFPAFSFAVTPYMGKIAEPGVDKLPQGVGITTIDRLLDILAKTLKYTYTIFFIVAVLFIILTAYTYLTAQDDAEKIKNVHKQLIWASVAIAVALMSLSFNVIISNFIKPSDGSSGGSSSGINKVGDSYIGPGGGAVNMPSIDTNREKSYTGNSYDQKFYTR